MYSVNYGLDVIKSTTLSPHVQVFSKERKGSLWVFTLLSIEEPYLLMNSAVQLNH